MRIIHEIHASAEVACSIKPYSGSPAGEPPIGGRASILISNRNPGNSNYEDIEIEGDLHMILDTITKVRNSLKENIKLLEKVKLLNFTP